MGNVSKKPLQIIREKPVLDSSIEREVERD
jgi:hypothetical protein